MKQYLVFTLRDEYFAIDILQIQEIIRLTKVNRVRSSCKHLQGLINIRDQVIPLINLKQRLFQVKQYGEYCIVIIRDDITGKLFSIMVDDVQEVISLPDELIDHPLLFSQQTSDNLIVGVGKTKKGLIVVIDIQKLLSDGDRTEIKTVLERKRTRKK